jgi:hypothetical protein
MRERRIDMQTVVQVHVKSVYGEDKVYPVNEAAETFARIAGTKTLTPQTMMLIRQLGYTIELTEQPPVRPSWIYGNQA